MRNENKKIAFLTAAYNGEKTLQRTIDSIKAQTHQNFEYFILNDGSQDGTQRVIDENCRIDKRLHSLYFEKNDCQEHFIAAIKEILKRDDFDYFAICDHDDEYLPLFAEYTLEAAARTGADAVFTEILYNTPEMGDGIFVVFPEDKILRTPKEFADAYPTGLSGIMRTQWGKLFSIKALRETNLEVIKILKYGRDTIFCNEISSHCDTIVFLTEPLYRFYATASTETNRFEPERINSPEELYKCTFGFITAKCGEYAYQNQDFIYFNFINDLSFTTNQVKNSDLSESLKIDYLTQLYSSSVFLDAAIYPNIYNVHIPANIEQAISFEKLCDSAAEAFLSLFPFVNEKQLPAFASAATHTAILAGYENPMIPIMGQAGKAVIVTLCHNSGEGLRHAIQSVLSQTYWNFDYYLVDNASIDNTRGLISEFAETDPRIHVIFNETNKFPDVYADLLPKILENSEYKYFAVCDHDDSLALKFLENAIKTTIETGADIVISSILNVDKTTGKNSVVNFSSNLKVLRKGQVSDEELIFTTEKLACNAVLFSTGIMRKSDFSVHTKTVSHHDCLFLLDNLSRSNSFAFIPEIGYIHNIINTSGSKSFSIRNIAAAELLFEKMTSFFSAYSKEKPMNDNLKSFLISRKIFEYACFLDSSTKSISPPEFVKLAVKLFDNEKLYKNREFLFSDNEHSKKYFIPVLNNLLRIKDYLFTSADEPEKEALNRIYKFLEEE